MRIYCGRFEQRLRISALQAGEVPGERIVDAIIGMAGRDGLEGGLEPARRGGRPHGIPDAAAVDSDAAGGGKWPEAAPTAGDKRGAGASERQQIGPTGHQIDTARRREAVQGGCPVPILAVPNPSPRITDRTPSAPGTGRTPSTDGSEVMQ